MINYHLHLTLNNNHTKHEIIFEIYDPCMHLNSKTGKYYNQFTTDYY